MKNKEFKKELKKLTKSELIDYIFEFRKILKKDIKSKIENPYYMSNEFANILKTKLNMLEILLISKLPETSLPDILKGQYNEKKKNKRI